jgi:hypothetical protein
MTEDGSRDLGDMIVYFKNGAIHRENGPAIEFKDGRKLWVLNGKEVTEHEVGAYRQENDRKTRELADQIWQSHQADQLRQYSTGLKEPTKGLKKLKLDPSKVGKFGKE